MTTDRLALYNIACYAIGERRLASLTEDREARHRLDEVWQRGQGGIKYALEQGYWNFAMRAVKMDASTSVEPEFGFQQAFEIPEDFVRLNMISSDEYMSYPLTTYEIEGDYIYCEVDPLYLRYISDHNDYGGDLGRWPETFTTWFGTWLGLQIAPSAENDIDLEALRKLEKRLRIDARSKDAQMEPPRWPPLSSWAQARLGRAGSLYERGLRNKLIGR